MNTVTTTDKDFQTITSLKDHLNNRIIGQAKLVERLLIALLSDGHLLVEGAPGLAKTKAIKELSACVEGDFHRIQFTPDLLPADVTGTDIYYHQEGRFQFQPGPIFHNLILADEINRAPAKVQSALLEAMAERQVTIGKTTYTLPKLFLVMATQNPIEQEGTFPLPEAQLDRFLMYVKIGYPDHVAEQQILKLVRDEALQTLATEKTTPTKITQETLFKIRHQILNLHMHAEVEKYIVDLVMATRDAKPYSAHLAELIQFGGSPRASISLDRTARAHAWLNGRDYVSPEDIQAVAHDVLRHRILLSFEAEADNISTDHIIDELLSRVALP